MRKTLRSGISDAVVGNDDDMGFVTNVLFDGLWSPILLIRRWFQLDRLQFWNGQFRCTGFACCWAYCWPFRYRCPIYRWSWSCKEEKINVHMLNKIEEWRCRWMKKKLKYESISVLVICPKPIQRYVDFLRNASTEQMFPPMNRSTFHLSFPPFPLFFASEFDRCIIVLNLSYPEQTHSSAPMPSLIADRCPKNGDERCFTRNSWISEIWLSPKLYVLWLFRLFL